MAGQVRDEAQIKQQYDELEPRYTRLAQNVKVAIEDFLRDEGIGVLSVSYRIKTFPSFLEKIERKGYSNGFVEMEDICGLRIICWYLSDLERISELIRREFDVKESEDKASLLDPDTFGYRSIHFVVGVEKGWCHAPNYRGLQDLKIEIQVRTVLMHAWADIQHRFAYKKREYVPKQFQRRMYQLSALFELADGQIEGLRLEREQYLKQLVAEEDSTGEFDVDQPMNLDTLQAVLDVYLAGRPASSVNTGHLLDELVRRRVTIKDVVDALRKSAGILLDAERDYYLHFSDRSQWDGTWTQVGAVRSMLYLVNNAYYQKKQDILSDRQQRWVDKWRPKLASA